MTIILALLSRAFSFLRPLLPYLLCAVAGAWAWQHFLAGPKEGSLQAQINSDIAVAKQFVRDADEINARHRAEMAQTKEGYDAALERQKRDLADARDTGDRLRSAVAIYAGIGQGVPSPEDPAVLRERLQALGILHEQLAEDYRQRAAEADAVNDALRACESTVTP